MKIDLTPETWRVICAVLMDDPVPRRVAMQAILSLEAALKIAQSPSATEAPHEP